MGFSGGTDIARPLIEAIRDHVPNRKVRRTLYGVLYNTLTDADWDCVDEAAGIDPTWDELIGELCPREDDIDDL